MSMMETHSDNPYVNVPDTIGVAPDKQHTEKALRLLAGYIIQNTSCHFLDKETGKTYADVSDFDLSPTLKIQSLFNDWKYWNGVIHMAFHELGELLSESQYIDYVKRNYSFFFHNLPFLKKLFDERVENASGHQFFRMDRLDDFGAMGASLFEVLESDPKEEFKEYLEKSIDYISNHQDRLDDGTFCRRRFGYTSLWGDDLYMSIPFLVRAWKYKNDENLLDDAIRQVFNFRKYLFKADAGIYYHYRIMEEGHPGVAHWGRANGWMVMAQCQLLEALPEDHPRKKDLIALLKEHLLGLARHQTASGMWRQLLDKSDSFRESSCTAMFTYGFAKAINKGWISDIYTSVALQGWKGLLNECITATGYLDKVTTGFNFKQDLPFYYNIPIEPGGDHGIGAAIYAGMEIYKLNETYRDCVWC
jgi:unsaturated rhamnogalacturonyl hydrolase